MHIGSEDSQIVLIVNSSSVNCIFKNTVNFLPLDTSCIAIVLQVKDHSLSSFEITIGEFVVFSPALWDISSSFLDECMKPRENEEKLSFSKFQLLSLGWSNVLESTHQVVTNTWRSFISYFQT